MTMNNWRGTAKYETELCYGSKSKIGEEPRLDSSTGWPWVIFCWSLESVLAKVIELPNKATDEEFYYLLNNSIFVFQMLLVHFQILFLFIWSSFSGKFEYSASNMFHTAHIYYFHKYDHEKHNMKNDI